MWSPLLKQLKKTTTESEITISNVHPLWLCLFIYILYLFSYILID